MSLSLIVEMARRLVHDGRLLIDRWGSGGRLIKSLLANLMAGLVWALWQPLASQNQLEVPPPAEQTKTATTTDEPVATVPVSVNYHFTRRCNYKCGFCFHTAISSYVLPLEESLRGLRLLKEAGMEKVNFSGGEPFLEKKGDLLGDMVRYCKETLALPSVSIVSNGSLITEEWFQRYGEWLDILAVSCDSFDEATNRAIGRHSPRNHHLDKLYKISDWCREYKVAFKINTVVNSHNWEEDMSEFIMELRPCRWKTFQCLLIGGENCGEDSLRHAESFVISDAQFGHFLETHKRVECLVPESNEKMRDSYLILDERMRFLDCTRGRKEPSRSILDVGVANAICDSGFDERMFLRRGGVYKWSKNEIIDW